MERSMKNSLADNDSLVQSIIDASQDGIIVLDCKGCIVFFNRVARQIFELYGSISDEKHISSIKREIWEVLQEMLAAGLAQHVKRFELNSRIYLARLSIIKHLREVVGILCVFQDSLDFSTLPRGLEKMGAVIDSSYDGIHVIDGQGNVVKVNPSWERIIGLKARDVVGRNVNDLLREGYYSTSVAAMVIREKRHVTLEGQAHITGKKVLVSGNPMFDCDGKLVMVVNNVRDLTFIQGLLKQKYNHSGGLSEKNQQNFEVLRRHGFEQQDIVAESRAMKDVLLLAERAAMTDVPILITGETGVGKEVVAEFIHKQSERPDKLLLKINCGAIPENLLETEFFGYEGGTFTGANSRGKPGLFEVAEKGTIMLDEVGELPPKMQVKLLRAIQDLDITRVGSAKSRKINVRLIALTNSDLVQAVEDGAFRKDLYFRLFVLPIHVPALRERPDDTLCLMAYFLKKFNAKYGKNVRFSEEVTHSLMNYNWPGNVRELKHLVERIVIVAPHDEVVKEDLNNELNRKSISSPLKEFESLKKMIRQFELDFIKEAVKKRGGIPQAARYLKINPATVYRKLKIAK